MRSRALARSEFVYEVNSEWESSPADIVHGDASGIGVDSRDRVYVLTRNDSQVLVFERDGTFLHSWGQGMFSGAHGLTVGPDDSIYCVDNGAHWVQKFTPEGNSVMTLGHPGEPSDTGYDQDAPYTINRTETITRPGPPFNRCTNLAVGANGDLYVTDGYGNCRVHRFGKDGGLLQSWGEPGVGPGQFHLPHGVGIGPDQRVLVCDRENDRIQVFDPFGEYITEWTDVQRPNDIAIDADGFVYVAELWRGKGTASFRNGFINVDLPGRVTILDNCGYVVARWGASTVNPGAPGNFIAPHGIAVDSHGDVYVAEVTETIGIRFDLVSQDHAGHQIQKFQRK
jgi:DNA-binding beta-propeller fold protein YncE